MSQSTKEKRLQLLAQLAGIRVEEAMSEGNRGKAYVFMNRMYRIQAMLATLRGKDGSSGQPMA